MAVGCWTTASQGMAYRWAAVLLVVAALITNLLWRRTLRGATLIHGRVVDHVRKEGADGCMVDHPVIQFRDTNQEAIRFESYHGASWDRWPVGTYVSVRTDRGKPEHHDPSFVRLVGVFVVGMGLLILLL